MHGKIFTIIYIKRSHTSDIELQIVHTVWLKYHWNIIVKFTLTMFNGIYIIMSSKESKLFLFTLIIDAVKQIGQQPIKCVNK